MPSIDTRTTKAMRRTTQRGAVLAEASVVLTTLVIFFGAINFLHSALGAKLDVQQEAREEAFQKATRHCEDGANDNIAAADLPIDGVAGEAADLLATVVQAASPINYGAASSSKSKSVAGALATYDAQGQMRSNPLGITVRGESHVLCTPIPRDGNVGGVVQYGVDYMKGKLSNIADIVADVVRSAVDFIWDKITGLF